MSRQLCKTHPEIDYKKAWGCPECVIELRDLVHHMWIHDGYMMNGYIQMTTKQKGLYCLITKTDHEQNMEHCTSK